MRRFLPAALVALLAAAVATPVQAGYLIIRVILEGTGSGPATGGGPPAFPGSFSSSGGPPGGKPGGPPQGSGLGPPGGIQAPFNPGSFMGPPGVGGMTQGGAGHAAAHDPARSVVIVVPVTEDLGVGSPFYPRMHPNPNTNPSWKPKLHITDRGQKLVVNLFTDSTTVQWYENLLKVPAPRKTRATEVHELHAQWAKAKAEPKLLLAALTAALAAGMIDDSVAYADELLEFADKKDGMPADVAAFARAYGAMQKGIKGPASRPGPAEDWRVKLDAQNLTIQGHYALISWDTTPEEVRHRAELLEENFRGFFLWHAVRGVELPVPESPLVVVLPKSGKEVLGTPGKPGLRQTLDGPEGMPADGFYSTEHDVLVLSPERLDEVGLTFASQTRQIYREGVRRDLLLSGEGPPAQPKLDAHGKLDDKGQPTGRKPEEVARMETLALVDRLVEEDAAVCAISREGTRQLLYATGRLPRHVVLPEWLANGAVNMFTRPKAPAFYKGTDGKNWMTVATSTGYGMPNYVLQRYFTDMEEKKELNPDRAALLRNVLTDAYFRGLRDPSEANDPDPAKPDATGIALNSGGKGPNPGGIGPGRPGSIGGGVGPFPAGPGGKPGGSAGGPPPGFGSGSAGGPPPGFGSGSAGGPPPGFGSGSAGGPPPGIGKPGGSAGGPPPGFGGPMMTPGGTAAAAPPPEDDATALLRKHRERLDTKAQATSWALFYYLAKDRPAELRKFLDELAAMPRDLPLDEGAVTAAFDRAFGLDGTKASYARFTGAWLGYMQGVPRAGIDIPLVDPKPPTSSTGTPAGRPGIPGLGGFPGAGSGGKPGSGS